VLRFESVSPRIVVDDLQDTLDFYLRTLEFDHWSGWPDDAPTFAIVSKDGVCVQLQQSEGTAPPTAETTTLHFTVKDVLEMHRRLATKTTIEWGPEVYSYGRREFAIKDCNGVMLIFSEPTDEAATCEQD
jgi:uncharacterized glyoxalase superfamily protein PhnB